MINIGEKIFIFGKDPGKDSLIQKSVPHPLSKKQMVRFVKDVSTGNLYFNFKDFLKPYKNKKYEKVVLNLVPLGLRKLDQIWMWTKAWEEIKTGIENDTEKEIISGWKERLLF